VINSTEAIRYPRKIRTLTVRCVDATGLGSWSSGGIRHVLGPRCRMSASRSRLPQAAIRWFLDRMRSRGTMIRAATPATPKRDSVTATPLNEGNRVLTTKMRLKTTRTPMMVKSTTFCQVLLTQGPRTSLSLRRSTRNKMAEGSRMPANTCTHWVSVPSRGFLPSSTTSDATTICPA
jgi:hypothetical protein